jgi:hypothetical protein
MTEEENQSKLLSLFGETARRKVILATTRWDIKVDEGVRANRQQELLNEWGAVRRLEDSVDSAWRLVETLLEQYAFGEVPQLQELNLMWNDSDRRSAFGSLVPWFRQLLGR